MQEALTAAIARPRYGEYILRTGTQKVRQLELVYGTHWYRTRFAGKAPILDLGPGAAGSQNRNAKLHHRGRQCAELVAHYRQEGINITLGEAYQVPYPDASFEGVFCCWLLEHLSEPERATSEMYRIPSRAVTHA